MQNIRHLDVATLGLFPTRSRSVCAMGDDAVYRSVNIKWFAIAYSSRPDSIACDTESQELSYRKKLETGGRSLEASQAAVSLKSICRIVSTNKRSDELKGIKFFWVSEVGKLLLSRLYRTSSDELRGLSLDGPEETGRRVVLLFASAVTTKSP